MREKLEKLIALPLKKKIPMLVGVLALFSFSYYYVFLSASFMKIEELKAEEERLEMEVAKKKGISANLDKFREEVRSLDRELTKALRELPDKKSIDILLSQISDKARNSGLEISLFQPSPERVQDFYAEIPVEISVSGSFHQLAAFFNEVGDLDRIVNLTEYTIGRKEKDSGTESKTNSALKTIELESTITATSFRFLEESERKIQEEKKQKKE